ncbi:MAG: hypothetical protein KU37_09235 [Sulfuricurvum sp. PC08-66]|nr:MAG: hypothetical protein KU37_09235 [Sulfuricurvum sp. PC08-66]
MWQSLKTIRSAHLWTTLLILGFTVLFSLLLINDNYHDYEKGLHTHIQESESLRKSVLIKNTLTIATLAFILFAVVLGIYKVVNTLIARDIERFQRFFADAAHQHTPIDAKEIFFKDFAAMVEDANHMIATIATQKASLHELNTQLEARVAKKTQYLIEANATLQEEKRFSEELLRAQKEFLRYTVHETNTPVAVMLASIELFRMRHPHERHLAKIEAAAKHIYSLYDDLSYLIKKEQLPYPKSVVDLDAFLRSRIAFFDEVAQLASITFAYEMPTQGLYIHFNESKLQRIIDNTLTNAIKYTLPRHTVTITTTLVGTHVDVTVASHSKKIEDPAKIFDPFYREARLLDGFGLGLSLVRTICDEEGVAIHIDSHETRTAFSYRFKIMGE